MRHRIALALLVAALPSLAGANPQSPNRSTTIPLPPTWVFSAAVDVNARGDILGWFWADTSTKGIFVYNQNDGLRTFSFPGFINLQHAGINSQGDAVGTYAVIGDDGNLELRLFYLHRARGLLPVPDSAAGLTGLSDINSRGTIVGFVSKPAVDRLHGVVLSRGTARLIDNPFEYPLTVPTSIADNGLLVGFYGGLEEDPKRGFILRSGEWQMLDYPGASETFPLGVASDGAVAGFATLEDGTHGFLYRHGVFSDLGLNVYPYGVTASGWVVGVRYDANLAGRAFAIRVMF